MTGTITWNGHCGQLLDSVEQYDVISCNTCGFSHIVPIPGVEELDKVYRQEYYTSEKPLFIERQQEDIEWWNVVYNDRYDFFEKHLSPDHRDILDIGCGPGFFLKRGQERGWQCTGLEPSRQAASFALQHGFTVKNMFLHEADFVKNGEQFDVVHLSEVLEHIPDPRSICLEAYDVLKDGGLICIVVPNDYSSIQNVLRAEAGISPYWLAPPHHINYFNFESATQLLRSVGFEIMESQAMFPIDFFLLMGDNYIGNDALGRQCHLRRKNLDIMLNNKCLKTFKEEMYSLMAKHGIGREAIIYGRKPTEVSVD